MIIAKNRETVEEVIDNVVSMIKKSDIGIKSWTQLLSKGYEKVERDISWKSFVSIVYNRLWFDIR